MDFVQHAAKGVTFLTSPLLSRPEVCHGFSTRVGGVSQGHLASLNLRNAAVSSDDQANVEENYRRFCAAVGLNVERVVLSEQVHQDTVRVVTEADAGKGLWRERDYNADALITNVPDLPLFVFSADCIVILLYDPVRRAIGAVHSGWRGTVLGIVKKAVEAMTANYGTDPSDLLAAIGPGIEPCCFETDADVPQALLAAMGEEARPFITPWREKYQVDLKGCNTRWLELAGVRRIEVSAHCTACRDDLYWSHRRMGGRRGVQVAAIALEAIEE